MHRLWFPRFLYAEVLVCQHGVEHTGDGITANEEVDESRTCNLRFFNLTGFGKGSYDHLSHFTRVFTGWIGQHHGQVGGEVAMRSVFCVGNLDPCVGIIR